MRKKHRLRALRNIAIALVLAAIIWALKGYDLPTMEMEMHRAERRHMLPESRVIWEYQGKQYRDRDMIVGLGPQYITTYHESYPAFFWPRAVDTPTLVLLPDGTRYTPAGTMHSYTDPSFLAVDAPSRAQSAKLSILLDYDSFSEIYTAQGEKQGTVWFFQVERRYYAVNADSTEAEQLRRDREESALLFLGLGHPDLFSAPCMLEFFDKDGACISALELNGGLQTNP